MDLTDGNKLALIRGGVHAATCSLSPANSIMEPKEDPMLQILLSALQTEEDRVRFERFYLQYENLMYHTVRQFLDSREDCRDVVQASCLYVIDQFDRLSVCSDRQLASYLVLLIKNRSLDLLDQRQHASSEDVEQYRDPAADISRLDSKLTLRDAFQTLPDRYKEALTLFYYQDLSIKEMSGVLHLSVPAVKKLLQRSRDALRKEMLAEGGTDR